MAGTLGGPKTSVRAPTQTTTRSSGRSKQAAGALWRGVGWVYDRGVRAYAYADHDSEHEELRNAVRRRVCTMCGSGGIGWL